LDPIVLTLTALACMFGGMLVGMFLRPLLPDHHLSQESKDAVKLGVGMVVTLAALVLGLLVASAKGTFDTMTHELRQTGAKIVILDRVMAQYGPETKEARSLLRLTVKSAIDAMGRKGEDAAIMERARDNRNEIEILQHRLRQLAPHNDGERWLQSRALQLSADIADNRWLLTEQVGQGSIPRPFIALLIFWLTIIFGAIGLMAPRNTTVMVVLFICVFSSAGSLYLIAELDQPYRGLIKISSAPLFTTLNYLGK
jgi:hypothetical protein